MKVQNRKCIRNLSAKSLWAARKRNVIAVLAIALTTLLFTSLFTVALSLNSSYETYSFRQIGGYSHGTFKEVDEEQVAAISTHPKVKEAGVRKIAGICTEGAFVKTPAEISYMDSNNVKWSYCSPTTGREAQSGKEVAMDTRALQMLGITPELGAEVELTFMAGDKLQESDMRTDTFILTGFWEYDEIMPVHYINVSEEYADQVAAEAVAKGQEPFRVDLNVMLSSSLDIRGTMEQIETDLGYQWEDRSQDNCVRIGVNWGYTSAQLGSKLDMETVVAIAAFVILVIFTGYLIIYNIFQISVTGDIRFYGLLKTIGVTPRQLRRMIRQQAMLLCIIGIPAGMLAGYGVGAVLTPYVLTQTTFGASTSTISTSPIIFAGAALFSLVTVAISCSRPGRMAAKVSPVEATKYTEVTHTKKKRRNTRGARVYQMAFANLGRNRKKTILVVISLSLSVVLLTILYAFVGGFDMEKYLASKTCADFIVGRPEYFRYNGDIVDAAFDSSVVEEIKANTKVSLEGSAYSPDVYRPICWISEELWKEQMGGRFSEEELNESLKNKFRKNGLVSATALIEGLDEGLLEKVEVVEGDLAPLLAPDSNAIAISVDVDDYGNVYGDDYPEIGSTLPVTYVEEFYNVDSRTGEPADENTPEEYIQGLLGKSHDVEYIVCALVKVPYSMSYRFSTMDGHQGILPVERLRADSAMDVHRMFYLFDTPDAQAEAEAESYLADLTADSYDIMYESKQTVREEFAGFQRMFLMLGGLLCFIIGFVGVLNFFNAIMTGILSRRREFAVLQSIGMTRGQLKAMLVWEGLFYVLGAEASALILALVMGPLAGGMMENMFWFFTYQFTITPVLLAAPVFALLGLLIPLLLYGSTAKASVVERLREAE